MGGFTPAAALLAIALAVATPDVDIHVAPDQPLPFVYVDDPLIVEFRATEDVDATVLLHLRGSHDVEPLSHGPISLPLRAHGARWYAIEDGPKTRGYYTVEVEITAGAHQLKKKRRFCRIDRRLSSPPLPVWVETRDSPGRALHALRAINLDTVLVDGGRPEAIEDGAAVLREGFRLMLCHDASQPGAAALSEVAASFADGVARWDISAVEVELELAPVVAALSTAASNAPIALRCEKPHQFERLLRQGAGRYTRLAVLSGELARPEVVLELRQVAERAGYEGWEFAAAARAGGNALAQGPAAMQWIFGMWAAGAAHTGLPLGILYDGELTEAFVFLNGLGHRFAGTAYGGSLEFSAPVQAPLFRDGSRWMLALWTEDGSQQDVSLPVGDAQGLLLSDALGNEMACPAAEGGELLIPANGALRYLSGEGGRLLGLAALGVAQREARDILENAVFGEVLANAVKTAVSHVAQDVGGETSRADFLAILRSLPRLEGQWHAGRLDQSVAVPAMAALARLERALGAVEQYRGAVFIEPLPDTLARCEEYQSLYLTGSIGPAKARQRGDWLLREVRRLMEEAEELAASGRPIEASAVALLAEWRARGLEYTGDAVIKEDFAEEDEELEGEIPEVEPGAPVEQAPAESPAAADPSAEEVVPPVPEAAATRTPDTPPTPAVPRKTHTVASGDNPSVIANKHDIELDKFLTWNGLSRRSVLHIGDEYFVSAPPGGEAVAPAEEPRKEEQQVRRPAEPSAAQEPEEGDAPAGMRKVFHTVQHGDSPYEIAKKYGAEMSDFFKWNNMRRGKTLHPGEKYVVYVREKSN